MTADLDWFVEFLAPWNGVSLIPKVAPHKIVQVDACLTGIGATDGRAAYAARIAPDTDPVANITEVETINVVVALHTFITADDAGGHILVPCDNLPAVQALTSSRAHNPILVERTSHKATTTLLIHLYRTSNSLQSSHALTS